jgi:hypothetical protein
MPNVATAVGGRKASPARWLKEYGKDPPIAILTVLAILAHLLVRYVWRVGPLDVVPLYVSLVAGGIPLIVGLARQALKLEFGSD